MDSNIPPVTDEDIVAAHNAVYARPDSFHDVPVAPISDDYHGQEWRAGLKRALEADRARVFERVVRV